MSTCGKYSQHPELEPRSVRVQPPGDSDPQVDILTGFPMGIPVVSRR